MIFWIFILFILLILSRIRYNALVYWGSALVLVYLAGFRDITVGVDTKTYEGIFRNIENFGADSYMEYGWVLLNKLIFYLGGNFTALLTFVAFFTIIPVAFVFKKLSPNPQLSLFIYYALYIYLNSYNIMRQCLAVSIVFVGYYLIYRRKYISALLIILLAITIHNSAFIGLPLLFINLLSLKRKYLVYFSLFATLLIGIFLTDSTFRMFAGEYATHLDSSHGYRANYFSALFLSFLLIGLFIYIYNKSDLLLRNSMFMKIYFISIVLNNLVFQLDLGTRLTMYVTIIQTLVYPYFFNKKYQYTRWIIITYLCAVFFKIAIFGGDLVCPPYKFIEL